MNFLPLQPGSAGRVLPFMASLYAQDALEYDAARALRVAEWLLANPSWGGLWIIEADGQDAGYFVITIGCSLEFHGRFALLDELYIEPDWRGRGLGPSVIDFSGRWARERGLSALRLEVAEENAHGLYVYRKSGFLLHDRRIMTKWL